MLSLSLGVTNKSLTVLLALEVDLDSHFPTYILETLITNNIICINILII